MKPGLYEQLMTRRLARLVERLPHEAQIRNVDPAEAPRVLARHLAEALTRLLSSTRNEERVRAVNELLIQLADEEDLVDNEARELLAILPATLLTQGPERPGLPLNVTELLVNARGEHRIGVEILKELQSADRVDLLCSFLKWSGYRVVRNALEQLYERGSKLRVLTTCYLGATDLEVLEALTQIAEVKVSYDTRRTRLHAKAWLFHRNSGFSTGYIGSSNLSSAALLDGLEWNVRVSHTDNPRVLEKFQATFDSYWEDGEFEPFDAARFALATRREQGAEQVHHFTLDVTPYPFQREILEKLDTERELRGQWRNLIVAATGTGKTVMAALDYRRVRQRWDRARLLFVAHRNEILEQSLTTFRAVLRDGSFGEKWTGAARPTQEEHLFASVQKLANVDLEVLDPQHFDVLIIDEFHHAAAPTYRRLIAHLRPRLLLGLTATPERSDGQSVTELFGAPITAELRLWDALERGLLSPFQYFGLHDNTDLRLLDWRRGVYQNLDGVYTGDHARARLVLQQVRNHVLNPRKMRALGFCAGVGHARFMAEEFCKAGLPAVAVLGETAETDRREAVRALRLNELCALFTVDVFNEGVDVPEVDTVLLLRPTESATIFLQQLGRGLRLSEGKECLTVLDFIGLARQEFRFDLLYTALLGGTRKELLKQLEQGFPVLPSGCSMQLDRQAMRIVLDNLRGQLRTTRSFLRTELQRAGAASSLAEFLERSGLALEELYGPGWVALRREIGVDGPPVHPKKVAAVKRMLTLDNIEQIQFFRRSLDDPKCHSQREERMRAMLPELDDNTREELRAVLPLLEQRVDHLSYPLTEHPDVPLRIHCHHSLADILTAFAVPYKVREGVYFDKDSGCDLFFVTLKKSERDYSPSTLYRDFAISPELFHWESQSTTREDSATGRRYQSHLGRTHALLFVREARKLENGETAPYLCLGPAWYVSHEGERPMAITWRLKYPIPIQFYRGMRLAA